MIVLNFTSCASDVYDSDSKEALGNIATAVSVTQVKATGNEDVSRAETKAPEMRSFKMKGGKGEMFLRYTATAGISGKDFEDSESIMDGRGKMITTATFYDDYGLFMYEYPKSQDWSTVYSSKTPKIVNERVLKANSWKTNEIWPGAGARLALYGYAPYNAAGVSLLPSSITTGKPTFRYLTPYDVVSQRDLLVSEDDVFVTSTNESGGVDVPGNYNAIKTLKFKHACTAVRVAVGERMAPCTITKIAIKGVYGEATYNFAPASSLNPNEGGWEDYSETLYDYTLTSDFAILATDKNKVINTGKYTFMLLPQTVPDDALLEITLDDGKEHTLSANIGGSIWKMGYSITYFITTSSVDEEYKLFIEPSDDSSSENQISFLGGSKTFTIKSYRQTFYGSQVAIPWTLSYKYGDDVLGTSAWLASTNDIISGLTFSGNGGTDGENVNFDVAQQVERSKTWRSTHTATLRAAAQQGTSGSPVDLSAGKQTANCYVVSAPGYYKFPLVYGNAINADGSTNSIAYNPNSSTFVDHTGTHITSPYIYETNGGANVPASAFLVWQDAPRLVTPSSVKLSDDKHYIEFQVEQKNICQGNSVLAVCDANGTIMWSWHIWVTDHSMTNTIEVHNNPDVGGSVISHFMEVPLGWCDAEVRVRDKRTFEFKVKQTETGGETGTITYEQLSADSLYTYGNNAPYYQWGRKDPMLPSDGTIGNVDKPFYDKQREWKRESGYVSTGTAIQNPFTFNYVNNNDWSSGHNWDYWNINFTSSSSVNNSQTTKTIYDPSLSGFVLPQTAAFTFFTKQGVNSKNVEDFNVSGSWNNGWNFLTGIDNGTIFFEALGYRDTYNGKTGVIVRVGEDGFYWVAGASSSTFARDLLFTSNQIYPQDTSLRSYGYSIYSVKE